MDRDTCRHAFVPDSFPRCVRAQGLTLAHWNRYYRLLRKTQATLRFYKDGEREPLPEHLTDAAFRSPHRFMLEVDLAGLKLIWRLREIRELQFEFSPAAISTPERAVLLFRIILETAVGRPLGCVPRGVWQGTTRRNSYSIPTSCNAARRRAGRAPGVVAAFTP